MIWITADFLLKTIEATKKAQYFKSTEKKINLELYVHQKYTSKKRLFKKGFFSDIQKLQ